MSPRINASARDWFAPRVRHTRPDVRVPIVESCPTPLRCPCERSNRVQHPFTEDPMLKMQLTVGLAVMALLTGSALAQTSPAPTQPTSSGQVITQMTPDLMRVDI